jgi:signal transduction histidine kinase
MTTSPPLQVANPPAAATRKLFLGASLGVMALAATTLILVPSALRGMLSSGFLPHSYCYLFNKQLIALHVGSDTIIWLSYVAISCTLVYLVWRARREIPFTWMFLAFGLFIVACGFTHLMEVVVLWHPLYWLAGDVKLITAVASIVTAIALPGLVPQVHAMVTAAQLSEERRVQLERANADLRHLSGRVMGLQDAERRRIARELHDGVGQYLVAIKMSCEVALRETCAHGDSSPLKDSLELLDRCTAEVRTMSHLLHPPLLEEMGLASAVPWYVEGFTLRSGIDVTLDMTKPLSRLPQPVELTLFRVLQESLTNIHRHSKSKVAAIRLHLKDERVLLSVEDRGGGFDARNGRPAPSGVGIAGMRERVHELGGEFCVTSGAVGTTVKVDLPLHPEAECQNAFLS